MAQWKGLIGCVLVALVLCVGESAYVRPPARENLSIDLAKKDSTDPDQVHVSLAGPNQMKVSWMTSATTVPATVQYGTSPGQYTASASGVTTSYSFLLYKSGQMHHVVLGPLADSTTYYYLLGGFGPEYSFTTPPPAGPAVPIKFAVVGDLGQTAWTTSTLQHIGNSVYDVLIFAGDLSYADYNQPLWDSFGTLVSPYASLKPWMVTQGNHEEEGLLAIEKFRSYNTRWQMPHNESGSTSNLYYSFEVAGVHVLMLGSYADYSSGSDQYQWLQNQTPWLIAMLHAPWYNSNSAHQGEGDGMMAAMETLLYNAKVDIIFAGHVHAYERSTRAYLKQVDPCGIIYITIGDGGNREGLAKDYLDQPVWSVAREASFGHGELSFVNATHAYWSWHRNQDDESVLADDVWIAS